MAFRDAPAPAGYTLRPEAAAGFPVISPDRRTYTFTIRPGLRFSDGSPLTAANFKRELWRVQNPAMRSEGAAWFSDVKHVSASGHRLRIELSEPSGDLLMRLATSYACPVPVDWGVDPAGVPLLVGSGPYYVHNYEPNREIVIQRNPFYRGRRPHRVDRIVITIGGDLASNIRAVEDKQAEVVGPSLPFEFQQSLAQKYGVNRKQLFRFPGTVAYYVALNTSRPLFRGNVPLRKAVNLSLNRAEIAKVGPSFAHSQFTTDQIISRWVPGWVDHRLYPLAAPNLKRAKSLAAGHLNSGKATLWVSQVPGADLVGQANVIARQLSEIGLTVSVIPMSPQVIDAKAGTPGAPYDMVLTRYFLHYPDPSDMLIRLLGGENASKPAGNTNVAYFNNTKYNRDMAAADRLTGRARLHAFSNLDAKIMRTAAPWAPLYEGSHWLFVSKHVGCLKAHPVFRLDLAAICLR
jgi:ABC-type transport system substrate-binding protein